MQIRMAMDRSATKVHPSDFILFFCFNHLSSFAVLSRRVCKGTHISILSYVFKSLICPPLVQMMLSK